jgi:hypothetical protein
VKLKRSWAFCRGNIGWGGITVIPPGNFSTSKKNGSPNKDSVKRKDNCFWTRVSKAALIRLSISAGILEFSFSGSMAKITIVLLRSPKRSSANTTTLVMGKLISSVISFSSCIKLSSMNEIGFPTSKLATIL